MRLFTEIGTKISRRVMRWIETPSDHPRPQDDVPDAVVLQYLYRDYRKMLHERMTLIAYIRKLETIYKEAQTELFRISVSNNPPTRKRIVQNLRILTYNLTKEHIAAQQQLRKMLDDELDETTDVDE